MILSQEFFGFFPDDSNKDVGSHDERMLSRNRFYKVSVQYSTTVIDNDGIDESTKKNLWIIEREEGPRYRFICKLSR